MAETADFGTFGRFQETPIGEMSPDMKDAYDFTMKLRGVVPGPHKIWLANPKLSKTIVPTGYYYQKESTLTKAEIEIVTNIINGQWRAAYGNYEHEQIGEKQGHLDPDERRGSYCRPANVFCGCPGAVHLRACSSPCQSSRCSNWAV